MSEKMWGSEPFWGLGYEWDPDWFLTDRQKELRATLIELCEKEMRANAKRSDDELLFPRRNLELLGEHGFLGLTVPEEYGGLGENHVAYAMTCETIARYGCASTAMCYVMHIGAVNAIMLRATPELIDRYIRPLNSGKIGTLSYSDPETGSHFWYPISSGRRALERRLQGAQEGVVDDLRRLRRLLRRADDEPRLLRATTTSPSSSSTARTHRRSRRSGTRSACAATSRARSRCRTSRSPATRSSARVGDGAASNDESVDPWFLIGSSSVWNGIALGTIDIAKRHTTRKRHVDVGMRVADYPTIQDYVGEAVMDTNAARTVRLLGRAGDGPRDRRQHEGARSRRVRPRGLPPLGLADQVRGGQERRPRRRQDAPRLRRLRLQARHGARALPARRQGRLGHGPDERGAAPVRRQGRAARLRLPRLLEPDVQPPRGRERGRRSSTRAASASSRSSSSPRPRRKRRRRPPRRPDGAAWLSEPTPACGGGSSPRTPSSRRTSSGPGERRSSPSAPTSGSRSSTRTAARSPS